MQSLRAGLRYSATKTNPCWKIYLVGGIGQGYTGMVLLTILGNGSIAPALGPILNHIRMGMAANCLPRPQGAWGTAIGLVVLLTLHMCTFLSVPASVFSPLILASAPNHCLWGQGDAGPAVHGCYWHSCGQWSVPRYPCDSCRTLSSSAV